MSTVRALLREDLLGFAGYRSARSESAQGAVWLNANESPCASAVDEVGQLRRYPQPQPADLCAALAGLYGCDPAQLLVGRGSDEAIDLLVRAFCRPGLDAVVVTPPVFGMYAVSARLQGARVLEVPLVDAADDFKADLAAVTATALSQGAKLVFLCSPGNPAGGVLPSAAVIQLARDLEHSALVVVDEAYIEFSGALSLARSVGAQPNLAVLRTLSKAHALAGARIGCLVASADVIAALRCCQAPYPVPTPSAELALQAIASDALHRTRHNTSRTCAERESLHGALIGLPCVRRVYPSQANFLLVRFNDVAVAMQALLEAGIVVRDMRHMPQLHDALRISIGSPAQNRQVVEVLQELAAP